MPSLLASDPPLIREAWIRMQGWYKDAVDHPPPPSRFAIANMMAERFKLYRHVPSLGQPIPLGVHPFLLEESFSEDGEISWVVRRLRLNR